MKKWNWVPATSSRTGFKLSHSNFTKFKTASQVAWQYFARILVYFSVYTESATRDVL